MSQISRVTVCGVAILLLVLSVSAILWRWQRVPSFDESDSLNSSEDVFERLVTKNPGYVGMHDCEACHFDRVVEFKKTRHYLACVRPDPKTMPSVFDSDRGRFSQCDSIRFEMTRKEDKFVQTAIQSTATGEKQTSSQIGLVYGSGTASDEVYFSWNEDRLYELPVVWLHPTQEWGASLIDSERSGAFSRPMMPRCLECHTTWFEHVAGTENQYNRDGFILGVTCEKCHGPGYDHSSFHKAHPEAKSAEAIVHPGRLSRDRLIDLCAQCHSNAIKYRKPPLSYRPGEPLDQYFKTLDVRHPEDNHVANQVEYMRESRCFQKSDTMTCITCHDPHRRDDLDERSPFQRSCSKCHTAADCQEQARLPEAIRDNCIGCHMPRLNKVQVFFQTKDDVYFPPVKRIDHRIAVYPAARDEVLLDWYLTQFDGQNHPEAKRLRRSLVEFWQTEAERCQKDFRFLAAIDAYRTALKFDDVPELREQLKDLKTIHHQIDNDWFKAVHLIDSNDLDKAKQVLQRILNVKPDMARAHGRLGMLYAKAGDELRAVESLKSAAKYDPDDPFGNSMLGWLSHINGRWEEALSYYQLALEAEPLNVKLHYQRGLTMSQLNRWPDAVECFRQVLELDPRHAYGSQGLAHAFHQQGQFAEALPFAIRAARLTRFDDPYILVTLAEAYLDVERLTDAKSALDKATPVAKSRAPQLLPQIRVLRDGIQAKSH